MSNRYFIGKKKGIVDEHEKKKKKLNLIGNQRMQIRRIFLAISCIQTALKFKICVYRSCQTSELHLHCLLVAKMENSFRKQLILPLKSAQSHNLWTTASFLTCTPEYFYSRCTRIKMFMAALYKIEKEEEREEEKKEMCL